MKHVIPTAKKTIVGMVAVGALSLGVAGMAGASTPASTGPARFNCANATKVLGAIHKGEASIAAGLPRLTAAQARAAAAGDTTRAADLERRITRFESATFTSHLNKVASAIEATCHVAAPGSSTPAG